MHTFPCPRTSTPSHAAVPQLSTPLPPQLSALVLVGWWPNLPLPHPLYYHRKGRSNATVSASTSKDYRPSFCECSYRCFEQCKIQSSGFDVFVVPFHIKKEFGLNYPGSSDTPARFPFIWKSGDCLKPSDSVLVWADSVLNTINYCSYCTEMFTHPLQYFSCSYILPVRLIATHKPVSLRPLQFRENSHSIYKSGLKWILKKTSGWRARWDFLPQLSIRQYCL